MSSRGMGYYLCLFCVLVGLLAVPSRAAALDTRGQVTFHGVPVPGATVTAVRGDKKIRAITNREGLYSLPDLTEGSWTIQVEMTGFASIEREVAVTRSTPLAKWELRLLSLDQMLAATKSVSSAIATAPPAESVQAKPLQNNAAEPETSQAKEENPAEGAANGLLINGSANNGAASAFAQAPAFGNHRNSAEGLYNGGIGATFDDSASDAAPYSLTGLSTPKPSYSNVTAMATLGGPLRIPHILPNGPNFFVGYQWTRDRDAMTQSTTVPTVAERDGNFSQATNASGQSVQIFDPTTGLPFPGNMIPPDRISYQSQSLLKFYPLPNFNGELGTTIRFRS